MNLYHFTREQNLEGIGERGLVPAIGKHSTAMLTFGIPVVWFTSNKAPLWMVMVGDGDGTADMCVLTVNVKAKNLHHWRTWLVAREGVGLDDSGRMTQRVSGTEMLAKLDPEWGERARADSENYWICTSVVHRKRITKIQRILLQAVNP
jgi:hypothetical protein